jgi:threonine dehydrogenase-like Zn-dependent dehydrogenase
VNLLKLPSDVPDEKGLYLSDVIATSWNCVVDTGVEKGDVVAIWGAGMTAPLIAQKKRRTDNVIGPIGQMCAEFAFMNGASRVIIIDSNWRLDFVKSKYPKVETIDYSTLPSGTSVTSKLKEMVDGRGPDVALECVAG